MRFLRLSFLDFFPAIATGAFAQSTASQVQELIVTGARGLPDTAGLAQQVQVAKDESVVTQLQRSGFIDRAYAG